MKTSIEVSRWYNKLFIGENEEQLEPTLAITLKHKSGTLEIPGISVRPGHTIGDIIKAYHAFLKQQPTPSRANHYQAKNRRYAPPPMDVGSVEYRGKLYLVEQVDEETFLVLREDRTPINGKSPTARAVLKRFRGDE